MKYHYSWNTPRIRENEKYEPAKSWG